MSAVKSCGCGCGTFSCGCCEGIEPLTPLPTANRAGLTSLRYRVGTHSTFLETMKARLSLHELPEGVGYDGNVWPARRPLASLATRDSADASIALLDAWATVADVLTFYQERIANEGYLRTAMEMRSVFELARLVSYKPRPGVAASVYLAYTIDSNTKEEVVIPKGARAQSVPGPGELPQSFETSEELRARATWNELKLRLDQPQRLQRILDARRLYLAGITTGLNPGDLLLARDQNVEQMLLRVIEVIPDPKSDRTRVNVAPWKTAALAPGERQAAARAKLENLLAAAPAGNTSDAIVEEVTAVIARAGESDSGDALPRKRVERVLDSIVERVGAVHGPAPKLTQWSDEVREVLAATLSAEAPDGAANVDAKSLVSKLSRRASKPLANALQLPRDLRANFVSRSDASLQLVGSVAPALQATLGPALAGQTDSRFAQTLEIYAFRVRAGVFGRNALKRQRIVLDDDNRSQSHTEVIGEWPIIEGNANRRIDVVNESPTTLYLDTFYEGILPHSWIVVEPPERVKRPGTEENDALILPVADTTVARVNQVSGKMSRAVYGMSGDTVRLVLDDAWVRVASDIEPGEGDPVETPWQVNTDFHPIRGSTIYARSEKLALALEPITGELCGGGEAPFELDGLYEGLQPGRFVVLTGERSDLGEGAVVRASEALMISSVSQDVRVADSPFPWTEEMTRQGRSEDDPLEKLAGDTPHTFVRFDKPLSYCYRRDTVAIRANVVKATHGETRLETLGNGEAAKSMQRFALKQFPLTHLAAPTAAGASSTLEVFVNDVRWHERETFLTCGPTDRVYVTKADEEGKAAVIFGNGLEGSRLPTGSENVKALYRNGIGKPGNVRAEQITQLSTRPLGVKDVINPLRASGGADRETRDQARRNTPNAVMALDRLVSTRDYADFSRSFAGIGKAASIELPDGHRTVVHVTIAGSDDIPIDRDSDLFINLSRALRDLGDPFQPVQLAMRELLVLVLSAGLRIDPDYQWEVVVSEVRSRLLIELGFERRELGRDVTSSEVVSIIQSVRGVVYVDLDAFGAFSSMVADAEAEGGLRPRTPDEVAKSVQEIVGVAPVPRVLVSMASPAEDGLSIRPAQLAMLLPDAEATLVLNRIE